MILSRMRGLVRRGPVVLLVVAWAVAACGSPTELPASPTPVAETPPSATASPAAATPSPSVSPPASPTVGQTETAWGTIWDALPPGFPRYPGSTPTEAGTGPASAVLDAPADVQTVTTWLQAELERAGYSTYTLSGPLEDGSMEIDSQGLAADCQVRTTVAPLGGSTIVTILYGVHCPPT